MLGAAMAVWFGLGGAILYSGGQTVLGGLLPA
jgi:hypothetical protein